MNIIWSGIYRNFKSIKNSKDAFNSQKWIDSLTKDKQILISKKNLLNKKSLNKVLIEYLKTFNYLKKKSYLKSKNYVLDYGGGIGDFYFVLSKYLKSIIFKWHVIEKKNVIKLAKSNFKKDKNIKFTTNIYLNKKIDIFFAGSSLQYIDDWKKLLLKFIKKDTKIFIFCDLPLINISQIITKQNYFGMYLPVRFYNFKILESYLNNFNYTLIYKRKFDNLYEKYTSKELKKYNLKFYNLIFVKKAYNK